MPDYSPTFMKKDPVTGLTFYDFEGHIRATGLDLNIGVTNNDNNARIAWRAADTGGLLAHVYGYRYGNGINFQAGASYGEAGFFAGMQVDQYTDRAAAIRLTAQANPNYQQSRYDVMLLDSTGYSTFTKRPDNSAFIRPGFPTLSNGWIPVQTYGNQVAGQNFYFSPWQNLAGEDPGLGPAVYNVCTYNDGWRTYFRGIASNQVAYGYNSFLMQIGTRHRPQRTQYIHVPWANGNVAGGALVRMTVDGAGNCVLDTTQVGSNTGAAGGLLYLDGLSFPTD